MSAEVAPQSRQLRDIHGRKSIQQPIITLSSRQMLIFCFPNFLLVTVFCFAIKSQNKFDLCFSLPSDKGVQGQVLVDTGCSSGNKKCQCSSMQVEAECFTSTMFQSSEGLAYIISQFSLMQNSSLQKEAYRGSCQAVHLCQVPVEEKTVFNAGNSHVSWRFLCNYCDWTESSFWGTYLSPVSDCLSVDVIKRDTEQ